MARAKNKELGFIIPKPVRMKVNFLNKGIGFVIADIKEIMEKEEFNPEVKEVIMAFVGKDFENAVKEKLLPKYRGLFLTTKEEKKYAMENDLIFGYSLRDGGEKYKLACKVVEEQNADTDKRIQACKDIMKFSKGLGLKDIVKKTRKVLKILEERII